MLSSDRSYKVSKTDLLSRLQTNRTKHISEYKAVRTEFRRRATTLLQEKLDLARAEKPFNLRFDLIVPRSHEREYDKVIGLLTMTTETTIDISPQDYAQFVLDEWNWKEEFNASNRAYLAQGPEDEDVGAEPRS